MEIMKARRSWIEVLQKLRHHGCKPKLLYPAKLSFTINGENKTFQDENKFKSFEATNPALQKVIEGKSQLKESNIAKTAYNNPDIRRPYTTTIQRRETHKFYYTNKKIK